MRAACLKEGSTSAIERQLDAAGWGTKKSPRRTKGELEDEIYPSDRECDGIDAWRKKRRREETKEDSAEKRLTRRGSDFASSLVFSLTVISRG